MATLIAGTTPEHITRACVLVIFGGVFDLLDGRVARITGRFSEFGVQLDSIADILGFGIAPAMIAWAWKLQHLGRFGTVIAFWYVVCTAFRLARFNVNVTDQSWPLSGHSQGLTSTMAGGALVTLAWMSNGYLAEWLKPSAWTVAGFVVILGLLEVSSVPYRNFKNIRQSMAARSLMAFALCACLVSAVVIDPSMWWATGAALYIVVGFVDGVVTVVHYRRTVGRIIPRT